MEGNSHNDITSILSAAGPGAVSELRGKILHDPWVRSGDAGFESDTVDLLLHLMDGSVETVRVGGRDAQAVAGRFAAGDRVTVRIRRRDPDGALIGDVIGAA